MIVQLLAPGLFTAGLAAAPITPIASVAPVAPAAPTAPTAPEPASGDDAILVPAGPTDAEVPAPSEVRDRAEAGVGAVPPPEQVRDHASMPGAGAPAGTPDPARSPSPPNPQARPSEGVYAVGSSGVAPLPPPPPPVAPSTLTRGRWSGVGWLAVRVFGSGPIAGQTPARPTVISLGGGVEGGWRIRQWIAFGAGFSRQPHEIYRQDLPDSPATLNLRGYMSAWDFAFLRLYAPVRGRIDPFVDVGGGLAVFDPARDRPSLAGGTVRASVGFEAWVARNLTLGLSGLYRANFVDDSVGHAWQAVLDFGVHW